MTESTLEAQAEVLPCAKCHGHGFIWTVIAKRWWVSPKPENDRPVRRYFSCGVCHELGFIDRQIRVLYAIDQDQAHEMARERRIEMFGSDAFREEYEGWRRHRDQAYSMSTLTYPYPDPRRKYGKPSGY